MMLRDSFFFKLSFGCHIIESTSIFGFNSTSSALESHLGDPDPTTIDVDGLSISE